MYRVLRVSLTLLGLAIVSDPSLLACSLCNPDLLRNVTLRQDAGQARLVLYGSVANPRLTGNTAGTGVSDFHIKAVLKPDPWLGKRTAVEVPRYVPVPDPKDPPRYLLFCDVADNRLDILRGPAVRSDAAVSYVKGLVALDGKPIGDVLRYCFDYLEHADRDVAQDAFLEFAKASDEDVTKTAPKLSAAKVRSWLASPTTPEERLGLYAMLLGLCGGGQDAALLRSLIDSGADRTQSALDGLLGGYIHLRPQEGWDLALSILKDERRSFTVRFAVVRMLRFFQATKPEDVKSKLLEGMAAVLKQSDTADLAIEDLRRWQKWDLTSDVLRLYGQKGYQAPLVQRAILRYALMCPRPEARQFADRVRRTEPTLIKEIEESLTLDKP